MSDTSDLEIFGTRAREMGMSDALIDQWLDGRNDAFGGGRPREALGEGRLLEAIEAAQAFCNGRSADVPRCNCASHGLAAEFRHGLGCPYGAHLRARAQAARTLILVSGTKEEPDA